MENLPDTPNLPLFGTFTANAFALALKSLLTNKFIFQSVSVSMALILLRSVLSVLRSLGKPR